MIIRNKRILGLFLATTMSLGLLAGCGQSTGKEVKEIKQGVLIPQGTTDLRSYFEVKRAGRDTYVFMSGNYKIVGAEAYDNLASMQLALDSGKIGAMTLPSFAGNYFITNNSGYDVMGVLANTRNSFAMGFTENNAALRDRVNEALAELEKDGTLGALESRYIFDATAELEAVPFENFDGAETITVAVTGDLPPMDYVGADGTPAGFNTALISAVAKKLGVNVKTINIESAARSAVLASGKADIVFWFYVADKPPMDAMDKDRPAPPDDDPMENLYIIDGVIFSDDYFRSESDVLIGKK